MLNLNDVELFSEMKDGNRNAFSEIVRRYSNVLLRFITRRIHSREDAEDILQDVLLSFWNRRSQLVIKDSIYPYLFKAVKYEIINRLTQKQSRIPHIEYLSNQLQTQFEVDSEDVLLAKELSTLIEQEVEQMPETMRTVFRMSRTECLSTKHIALKLSLSEQTVRNNISLAISRIRIKIK